MLEVDQCVLAKYAYIKSWAWSGILKACPRCAEKATLPYIHNDIRYCFDFLQASKGLQINYYILGWRGQ